MKNFFFVFGILLCLALSADAQTLKKFEFTIRWEIGYPNTFNSKTGEFQKDLVGDVYKGKLKLSKQEKKSILKKLTEINFWNIPERYNGTRPKPVNGIEKSVSVEPNTSYTISVEQQGKSHTVKWRDESIDMGDKGSFDDLTSLFNLIYSILNSHKEWKNSPQMHGGYM